LPTIEEVFRYLKQTGWTQQYDGALAVFQRGGDYLNIYRADPVEDAIAQISVVERRRGSEIVRDVRRAS
jgi:hypothetical protein